jgi:hypothetical protein
MFTTGVLADVFQVSPSAISQSLKNRSVEEDIRVRTIRTLIPTTSTSEKLIRRNYKRLVDHIKMIQEKRSFKSQCISNKRGRKLKEFGHDELIDIIRKTKIEILKNVKDKLKYKKVLGQTLRHWIYKAKKTISKIRQKFKEHDSEQEYYIEENNQKIVLDETSMKDEDIWKAVDAMNLPNDTAKEEEFCNIKVRRAYNNGYLNKVDPYPLYASKQETLNKYNPGDFFLSSDGEVIEIDIDNITKQKGLSSLGPLNDVI